MKFRPHSVFTLVMIFILAFALIEARDWPLRANILILVLGGIGLILAFIQLFRELKPKRAGQKEASGMDIELDEDQTGEGSTKRLLKVCGWFAGLFLGAWIIGFSVTVPLFSFLYSKLHGGRWLTAIIISVVNFVVLQGIFEQLLHIPWPDPVLRQFIPFIPD